MSSAACPFCGSHPQWRYKSPGGRDGDYELPLRAWGCANETCPIRPHTPWENRGHFVAAIHGNEREDPDGLLHVAAWNKRHPSQPTA